MMSILILATSIVTAPVEEEKKEDRFFQALGYAMFVSKAGDTISTHYALQAGGYEANPLMRDQYARAAATVAVPLLINWGTSHLYQKGHPEMALWMRIGAVVGWGLATANNLRH